MHAVMHAPSLQLYFRHVRAAMSAGGGVFVMDLLGGHEAEGAAWTPRHNEVTGASFVWEQEGFDPRQPPHPRLHHAARPRHAQGVCVGFLRVFGAFCSEYSCTALALSLRAPHVERDAKTGVPLTRAGSPLHLAAAHLGPASMLEAGSGLCSHTESQAE